MAPTAAYETFDDEEKAIAYLKANDTYPIVIKADGLASGKGVIIAQSEEEAIDTVKDMLEGHTLQRCPADRSSSKNSWKAKKPACSASVMGRTSSL